jgi:hypothetical protein
MVTKRIINAQTRHPVSIFTVASEAREESLTITEQKRPRDCIQSKILAFYTFFIATVCVYTGKRDETNKTMRNGFRS